MGLRPTAAPTAREAWGRPTRTAMAPYVVVVPSGIERSCSHTSSWKGVPCGSSGRPKGGRVPARDSSRGWGASATGRQVEGRPRPREVLVQLMGRIREGDRVLDPRRIHGYAVLLVLHQQAA